MIQSDSQDRARILLQLGVAMIHELLGFDSEKNSFGSVRKIKQVEFELNIELELLNESNSSFNIFGSSLSSLIRVYSNK